MDKKLVELMEQSYVDSLNSLKSDGSIQDFSIKQSKVSEEEVVFDISILPIYGIRNITTSFTVTKCGCEFNEEKK